MNRTNPNLRALCVSNFFFPPRISFSNLNNDKKQYYYTLSSLHRKQTSHTLNF